MGNTSMHAVLSLDATIECMLRKGHAMRSHELRSNGNEHSLQCSVAILSAAVHHAELSFAAFGPDWFPASFTGASPFNV